MIFATRSRDRAARQRCVLRPPPIGEAPRRSFVLAPRRWNVLVLILYVALAVALALLIAILLRLRTLPSDLRAQVRRERAEGHDEAMTVLREKAALSVGSITAALGAHEERLAAEHREETASAEVRARLAERRVTDTAPLLDTASELVRALRGTIDALGDLPVMLAALSELHRARSRAAPRALAVEASGPESNRDTVEMARPATAPPPPAEDEEEPEEELTKVFGGAGGEPRQPLRPPVFASSAPSAEPAQVAAGLGRRPGGQPRAANDGPQRSATMIGIQPPGRARPGAAPTLPSMPAVVIPAGDKPKGGAS
jgi:hypothetical protein